MQKHRMWLFVVVLAMVSLLVVACGGQGGEVPDVEEPAGDDAGEEMEEPADAGDEMEEPADEGAEEPAAEAGAGGEPAACADDEFGCAVIPGGSSIKIGYAGPMTGDNAAFGTDISNAGLVAIDMACQPIGDSSFELVIQDTGGTPEGGASVANLFVSDPTVVAIAGHTFSGSTEAAIPIYDDAGLPMLSPSATNPSLTEMGSAVFNRIAFTDQVQGEQAAAYLFNNIGAQTLAVVHDGGAYGQGLADVVAAEFEALGGEVVATEAVTPGETDYSAPLAAIGAMAPDAVYFGGYSPEASVIANQMGTAGLGDAVFFSDDGTYGVDFLNLAGENAEGAFATSLVPPESPARAEFDAAYEEQFGQQPGVLSAFTWNGFDIVAALCSVISETAEVGDDGTVYVPRAALVQNVRGLSGFEGLSGDITCSETGECNTAGPTFYMVQDGAWVLAP
ncbi:MAG TPA: branched-chain amino acid ABC transporter substrate-binding protein [Aggregatilineales bacterium]|nr:branched-chain amino acid ABC transporter substrate-binding protein [Aggregatilineales bacterium]